MRKSAFPVKLTSAPVELFSVTAPPPEMDDATWSVPIGPAEPLTTMVAAPALMVAVLTPLARSIALRTSLTVAPGAAAVPS
ncbi:hypothetical protein ACVWZZ_000927 [Bradyrhizobium sp. LM6.10]